jgi:DNA-binding HxlR family transcriptional regulator
MNNPPDPSPVELLTLARLLVAGEKGENRAKLGTDLKPLVEGRLDRAVEDLESAGAIDRVQDKKGKPTAKLALTEEGRRVALEALGLEHLPPKTTWAKLKSSYLVALALGRRGQPIANPKVEILRARYSLELGEKPTIKQASDATAAKLLGLEPGQPFNAESILRKLLKDAGINLPPGAKPSPASIGEALFQRELGGSSAKNSLDLIASKSVGARNQQAAELGSAILRTWIDRSKRAADSPAPTASEPRGQTLENFAQRVVESARTSPTGWFGNAKVFISHVWRNHQSDPAFEGIDQATFKLALLEAHRARLLELGRADLVDAMDPADVRESATPYQNVVYHFVRIEEPAR